MRRREVIAGLGLAAWPLMASAQQPTLPVIGVLGSASPDQWVDRLRAFREGLVEAGYVEGKNVALEYRWADGRNYRLLALAAELVRHPVAVIVVLGSTPSAIAAKAATTTVPVVFRVAVDPVELGLVPSLSRPGGNITGVTTLGVEVGPKQLELLRELIPAASVVALLTNPTNPAIAEIQSRDLRAAARALGLQLHVANASSESEFEAIFASLTELRAGGLVLGADAFFNSQNERLAALALRNAIPTISPYREFAVAGGLMSYGGSITGASRQAGVYAGRILSGEKPAELPVQRAVNVDLVTNLKTLRALGLTMPPALRSRTDEVIE
jgi:putative tryptophan/tyrosine transport system substrate-binding protein